MRLMAFTLLLTSLCLAAAGPPLERLRPADFVYTVPTDLAAPAPGGTLEAWLTRYSTDGEDLRRFYATPWSEARRRAWRSYESAWQTALGKVRFDALSQDGKVDYLVFRNHLAARLRRLDEEERRAREIAPLVPFLGDITALAEARQRIDPMNPAQAAALLTRIAAQV